MITRKLLVTILAVLVCGQPAIAQKPDAGDISAAEDPRLARKVSLTIKSGTIEDMLRGLSALTAVTLQTTGRAADQGVRLALKDRVLADALSQTATLFDWRWRRVVREDEIIYRLEGSRTGGDPGKVRQILTAAVREDAANQQAQLQPAIDAWLMADSEMEILKSSHPDIAATLEKDREMGYRVQEMSRLPEQERRRWIEDRVFTQLEYAGPEARYALAVRYVNAQTKTIREEPPPEDEPKISVKLQGEIPFWNVIEALSKQTGLSFISDRYSRRIVIGSVNFDKVTLRGILDKVCGEAAYSWDRNGDIVTLRSRLRFYDELREPPKQVIDKWLQIKKQRGGKLAFSDLAGLAASLTDDQVAGLAASEPVKDQPNLVDEGRNILNALSEFRLYNILSREQIQAAESNQGLSFLRMTPRQQSMFLRYAPPGPLPPDNAMESGLYIISRGDQLFTFRYNYGLGLTRSKQVAAGAAQQAPEQTKPPEAPAIEKVPESTTGAGTPKATGSEEESESGL